LTDSLEARIRRIEDRTAIVECTVRYGVAVDRRDWPMFRACFTDEVESADGSISGDELTALVRAVLDGFGSTQHLRTNHLVTFDDGDPDLAVCTSAMYAQHLLPGSPNGDFYLLRAEYRDVMRRTAGGWRIAGMSRSNSWEEGNLGAVDEARARVSAASA
jgi:hypothetical protein